MNERFIKEYIPRSWFHPKGIYKVVERLKPRLPNVNRCLFATFTLDRAYFLEQWMGPSEAFDESRKHIRKVFFKLRKGIKWNGQVYKIKSPYCTKVEFHDDPEGWPHFHVLWLTKKYVPADLIAYLWGFGRTNVKRIIDSEFHYLLKYICKSGKVPKWVQRRSGIRIFQSSKGFLLPIDKEITNKKANPTKIVKRNLSTIGERINRYKRTALVVDQRTDDIRYSQIELKDDFKTILDCHVYSIAHDNRYLGNGKIIIKNRKDYKLWIKNPTPLPEAQKLASTYKA